MARRPHQIKATVVLDSEGLSQFIAQHPLTMRYANAAQDCMISVATILEATHAKIDRARWDFVLSQLRIEPLTIDLAKEASELLRSTGLHGHKYAIDAMVAVTAMQQPGPVVLLTSDVDDMSKLCGKRVELVGI